MPYYYDTIRYPSVFLQQAKDHANFESLSQSDGFQRGASNWDSRHLFACRVLCNAPERRLSFLEAFFPEHLMETHSCIQDLVAGPLNLRVSELWEPQIVQMCQPDSLGYVWAALASFLRAEGARTISRDSAQRKSPSTPERPRRERTQTAHDSFVASDSFAIGSSPNRPQTASTESDHSIGYRGNLSAPLLEDATVRLAGCFMRCVLNYAQPAGKTGPFIHFRDERLTHQFRFGGQDEVTIEAIDDGGLQLVDSEGRILQVALLEGKRNFQIIVDGEPKVPDELLAQLVGEALALTRGASSHISNDVLSILAVADCIKLFRFKLSNDFIRNYQTMPILDNGDSFLQVDSTPWLSIKMPEHRELIVSHLLAIIAWAGSLA